MVERNSAESERGDYQVEWGDDRTVRIVRETQADVVTLGGERGTKTEREVVGELPAEWDEIGDALGEIMQELSPDVPHDGKSVTQQMDEAYDR